MTASISSVDDAARSDVIDDFLSASELENARKVFARLPFTLGHSTVEPHFDGPIMRGPGRTITEADLSGLPPLFATLWTTVLAHPLAPEAPANSIEFRCNWWQFPPGSGSDWHDDGGEARAVAFILYLHEEWNASWGGGLIASEWDMGRVAAFSAGTPRPGSVGYAMTASRAPARYVVPVPNRLVLLKSPTPHRVEPVHPRAGDRTRNTITGFVRVREGQPLDG